MLVYNAILSGGKSRWLYVEHMVVWLKLSTCMVLLKDLSCPQPVWSALLVSVHLYGIWKRLQWHWQEVILSSWLVASAWLHPYQNKKWWEQSHFGRYSLNLTRTALTPWWLPSNSLDHVTTQQMPSQVQQVIKFDGKFRKSLYTKQRDWNHSERRWKIWPQLCSGNGYKIRIREAVGTVFWPQSNKCD